MHSTHSIYTHIHHTHTHTHTHTHHTHTHTHTHITHTSHTHTHTSHTHTHITHTHTHHTHITHITHITHTHTQYPPVDPFSSSVPHGGSSESLDTQVDCFWETRPSNDTTLMKHFLHDSLSHQPGMLELLTEQYLSSASSGYGTTHSVDDEEYYQLKLNDVSTRYVREYFEHDPEGYVHMVPSRTQ